jgi:hypothetical protein
MIWGEIVRALDGAPNVDSDGKEQFPNEYHTSEYGTLYKNSVVKLIYDKFAEQIRIGHDRARGMSFDVDKLERLMKSYNSVKIKTTLQKQDAEDEDSEDSADSKSGSDVRSLIEKKEFAGSADISTDTNNNNGININITNNTNNSSKNYSNQSAVNVSNVDSMPESVSPLYRKIYNYINRYNKNDQNGIF